MGETYWGAQAFWGEIYWGVQTFWGEIYWGAHSEMQKTWAPQFIFPTSYISNDEAVLLETSTTSRAWGHMNKLLKLRMLHFL